MIDSSVSEEFREVLLSVWLHVCDEFLVFVCGVFLEFFKTVFVKKVMHFFVVVICVYDTRFPFVSLHGCCIFNIK
jgi:hypothetical protein